MINQEQSIFLKRFRGEKMQKSKVNVYQYGDTIRFQCTFHDFSDVKTDPQIVKIIIYNYKYEIITSEVIGGANKTDVGDYFYDYTTEKKEQKLYYEWYGEFDGKPSLKRGSFMTKFI